MTLRVRENPPLRLHHEIETPSGRLYRWGADEPRPENVPSAHSFTTTAPGGFDQHNITLPRKSGVDYSDLARLSTLRSRGAGGEIASEARLERAPRTSGDEFSIGPEARGWFAHLEDDQTASEIYRSIDLGSFAGPGTERKVLLREVPAVPYDPSVVPDKDLEDPLPTLELGWTDGWTSPYPNAEAWFDAGPGARVARVYLQFAGYGSVPTFFANFDLYPGASDDDHGASSEQGADLLSAASGSTTYTPKTPRRFFWLQLRHVNPGGGEGQEAGVQIKRPAVYGSHGLTLRGAEPEAGFYASDVIPDALQRWAPLLNFTTGSGGSLRDSSFVIPHLAFREQTTALAIVEGANSYELRPYFVWEDRTFHYHEWGDRGRKWRTRVAPSQLSETGPTIERLRNGITGTYQDVDGSTRSVGPPGSGCDVEDAALLDSDPENPANQLGIRRWGPPIPLDVSVASEAVRVCALYLRTLRETDTSGQMQLVGTVEDDRGVERPAWQVRAGDTIVPVDASDTRERRIIRTSYDDSTKTNTIDLDAPPDGTPDLLAQLGVSVTDLGL
jgi:hypothetical protein